MAFENLSSREKRVLQNLITHYIQTADPVGSRVIANKYRMGLSPATIRNTMQDLEELGLISQPHTSAGRIPTDTGYRFFVDVLLKHEPLTEHEKKQIETIVHQGGKGIDSILAQTSKILSEITSQLGLSISPRFEEGILRKINLIPVSEGKVLVIVAVKSGFARSILMELESDIPDDEFREIETVLNERLCGHTLGHIRKTISERLADTTLSPRLIKLFVDASSEIWSDNADDKLITVGTDNLIMQPEFADRERISEIIKLVENKKELKEYISTKSIGEGIIITIGEENTISQIKNCSVVTSRYKAGNIDGTIGIIGPTRMPYSKLISIVEYTARSLTAALTGSQGEEE